MIRDTSNSTLPGYINPLGITGSDFVSRASWPVTLFPHIEQNQLFEQYNNGLQNVGLLSTLPQIEIMVCPSNPPAVGEPEHVIRRQFGLSLRVGSWFQREF